MAEAKRSADGIVTTPPYTILGRFYDHVTRQGPGMNRHARRKLLGGILPRVKAACDVGCGSGNTAVELAKRGIKVYAVDASAAQCRGARKKVRRAGVPVRVIHADMRRFSLPEPVDLVLSEFNPINHLARPSALAPALRNLARALRPGGWLYFDLNMKPTYASYSKMTHWMEGPGYCVVLRGAIDERRRHCRGDCEWFVRSGRSWRRYRERVEDTWWSHAEIVQALRRAGFERIRSWDGARVRPRSIHARRGFDRYYLARKAKR